MSPSNMIIVRFSFWITIDTKSCLPVALSTRSPTTKRLTIFWVVLTGFVVFADIVQDSFSSFDLRAQIFNSKVFGFFGGFSKSYCLCHLTKTSEIVNQFISWYLFNRIHRTIIGTDSNKGNKKSRLFLSGLVSLFR